MRDFDVAGGLFLSYRRADSQTATGRLADDLRDYFGQDRVYLDTDSNRAGHDFVEQLVRAVRRSRVVLAVIGPHWLSITDGSGRRRLDDPDDHVRRELELALTSRVALLVVLLDGAVMPQPRELPPNLRPMASIQALRLSNVDWKFDFGRLLEALDRHGLHAALAGRDPDREPKQERFEVTTSRDYARRVPAPRIRAFQSVLAAVQALGYREVQVFGEAYQVAFRAGPHRVTAKVLDAGPGHSHVVVEYRTIKTSVVAAGTAAALVLTGGLAAVVGWPALRIAERNFSVGFLDNVQRFVEGRGVGENSATPKVVRMWRNRSREV